MADFPSIIDLFSLGTDGDYIGGGAAGDYAGWSVAAAGDVNGDGIDDILIGAPGNGSGAGKIYLVFGKAGGIGAVDLGALTAAQGFVITGEALGDVAGWSVASAGDLNHDGLADIVIGARLADVDGLEDSGRAYVIFGQSAIAGPIDLAALGTGQGFAIDPGTAFDHAGWSVASAGDVNHDGIDDLLIDVPGADGAGINRGAAYVVFGHSGEFGTIDLESLGSQGFAITGAADYDEAGRSVASAGDVNGDGFDDIIVGAGHANGYSGAAYVVFGHGGGFATVDLGELAAADGFAILGAEGEQAGFSVASAGDINGDGFGDLIVGAPYADAGAGRAYVVFGQAGPFETLNFNSLTASQGFVISGAGVGDKAGWSVAGGGDINGDGFDDLIVGAPYADNGGGLDRGAAHVILGHNGTFGPIDLGALDPDQAFTIRGAADYDQAGRSVAFCGDFNKDGVDDLIVGGPYSNVGDSGGAYIIHGKSDVMALSVDLDGGAGGIDYSGAYTEGGAGSPIGAMITVTEDLPITSATITITDAIAGDQLNIIGTLPAGITVSGGEGGTTLTLAGVGTPEEWADALALVRYSSASENPDAFGTDAARTISVVVSDGLNSSPPATATIGITADNDPPVLTASAGTTAFVEGSDTPSVPVAVDPALTLDDPDSPIFNATVQVTTGTGTDVLAFTNDNATLYGNITQVNAPGSSVVQLESSGGTATLEQWQNALRAITFTSSSEDPAATDRVVTFQVSDGTDLSNSVNKTVSVTPVNDSPSGTSDTFTIDEDQVVTLSQADFGYSDPENHSFSTIIFTGVTGGTLYYDGDGVGGADPVAVTTFPASYGTIELDLGHLTFVPTADLNGAGAASISFQVQDNGGTDNFGNDTDSSANTITYDITPVDERVQLFDDSDVLVATFNDLQDAIDAASDGYRIVAGSGTYAENLNVDVSVTIEGSGAVIDGQVRVTASGVTIDTVSIIGAAAGPLGTTGLVVESGADDFTLVNSLLDGTGDFAIFVGSVTGLDIGNNQIEGYSIGMYIATGGTSGSVHDNLFQGDGGPISGLGNGINSETSHVVIRDNVFDGIYGGSLNLFPFGPDSVDLNDYVIDNAITNSGAARPVQILPTNLTHNIIGTDFNEAFDGETAALNGVTGAFSYDGRGGDDRAWGGGDGDTFTGGEGDEFLFGNGGSDTAVYAGNRADYTITFDAASFLTVNDDELGDGDEGFDTLDSIERVQFADVTLDLAQRVRLYDGNGDLVGTFDDIQAAIDASFDGYSIEAGAGTYTENLTVDKDVTITGSGAVIDGQVRVTASGVTIDTVSIIGAAAGPLGTTGLVVESGADDFTLVNSLLDGTGDFAIFVGSVTGLDIGNNQIEGYSIGMYIATGGTSGSVHDNLFQGDGGPISGLGNGINSETSHVVIRDNVFDGIYGGSLNLFPFGPDSVDLNDYVIDNAITNSGAARPVQILPTNLTHNIIGTDFNEAFDGETAALNGVTGAFSYDGRGGDDRAWGGGDGDTFTGGEGDEFLFGNGGSDTAVYAGNRADYTITFDAASFLTVNDDELGDGDEGFDTLDSIERVQFADVTLDLAQRVRLYDGNGDLVGTFDDIQAAIDASFDGYSIEAGAGTYTENLTVDKDVTITGSGAVIDGQVRVTASGVTIDTVSIIGAAAGPLGTTGLVVESGADDFTLVNSLLDGTGDFAIFVGSVTGLDIGNNQIEGYSIGMYIATGGTSGSVHDNLFQGDGGPISGLGNGINSETSHVVIRDNVFDGIYGGSLNLFPFGPDSVDLNDYVIDNAITNSGAARPVQILPTNLTHNIIGTDFNEAFDGETAALNGVTGAFSYDGRGGDDRAWGGGDGDTFTGGEGDEFLFGNGGSDTAVYAGNRADYTITFDAASFLTVNDDELGDGDEGFDTLDSIERVQFADVTLDLAQRVRLYDGNGDLVGTFDDIQAAIDASFDGYSIEAGAGTYTENLTVDKDVTITGSGAVIDGQVRVTASGVTIDTVSIIGAAAGPLGTTGLVVESGADDFTLVNSLLDGTGDFAIFVGSVTGLDIGNNQIEGYSIGMYIATGGTSGSVHDNLFQGDGGPISGLGNGINSETSHVVIRDNVFDGIYGGSLNLFPFGPDSVDLNDYVIDNAITNSGAARPVQILPTNLTHNIIGTDFNEAFDGETAALNGVTGAFSYDGRGGDDRAWGGGDGDTFTGGEGDEFLFGNGGSDTAVYAGNRADYTITFDAASFLTVNDDELGDGDEGFDTLDSIERVQFADVTLDLAQRVRLYDGNGDLVGTFDDIQAAIDASFDGYSIEAGAGTYAENLTVDKDVTITGSGAVIDGQVRVTASGVTIDTVSIIGAAAGPLGTTGLVVESGADDFTLVNSLLDGTGDFAIFVGSVTGLDIGNNQIEGYSIGMYIATGGTSGSVHDNLFQGDGGPISGLGNGINSETSHVVIRDNVFDGIYGGSLNLFPFGPDSVDLNDYVIDNAITNSGAARPVQILPTNLTHNIIGTDFNEAFDGETAALNGVTGAFSYDGRGGDDRAWGGGDGDTFTGGEGDEFLFGNGGSDTAVYAGNRADYTITFDAASFLTVNDDELGDGDEGFDTLDSIERVQFADVTLDLAQRVRLYDGNGDLVGTFDDIQAAIDASFDGYSIEAGAGTYTENLTVDKDVTITGSGAVIDGQVRVTASGVTIDTVSIIGAAAGPLGTTGLVVESGADDFTLVNSLLDGTGDFAIFVGSVTGLDIGNNQIEGYSIGMYIATGGTSGSVHDNLFQGDGGPISGLGNGINSETSHVVIRDNVFDGIYGGSLNLFPFGPDSVDLNDYVIDNAITNSGAARPVQILPTNLTHNIIGTDFNEAFDGETAALNGVTGAFSYDGRGGDDRAWGGGDGDTFTGGEGDEFLFGNGGSDTAVYAGNRADYTITFDAASFLTVNDDELGDGDEGFDTLDSIERVQFADVTLDLAQRVRLYDGNGDLVGTFDDIQAAIDASFDGYSIEAGAGTYAENLTVDKDVTITGSGAVIDGQVRVTASGVTIDTVSIIGAAAGPLGTTGLVVESGADDFTLVNSLLDGTGDFAIFVGSVTGLDIGNNQIEGYSIGMYIATGGTSGSVHDNLFQGDGGPISGLGNGINSETSHVVIRDNVFDGIYGGSLNLFPFGPDSVDLNDYVIDNAITNSGAARPVQILPTNLTHNIIGTDFNEAFDGETAALNGVTGAFSYDGRGGDDRAWGGGDGDTFTGGEGDEFLFGNGGSDTAVYAGNRADYTITFDAASFLTVNDDELGDGDEGFDTLDSIERVQFADVTLDLAQRVRLYDGNGDLVGTFDDIQAAIDASFDGYSIEAGAGTYTENLTVDKDVTITGSGAVIDGQVRVTASGVTIDTVSIIGAAAGPLGTTGLVVESGADDFTLVNSLLDGTGDFAIFVGSVTGLDIGNNQIEGYSIGMYIATGGTSGSVHDNLFQGDGGPISGLGNGINSETSHVVIRDNVFDGIYGGSLNLFPFGPDSVDLNDYVIDNAITNSGAARPVQILPTNLTHNIIGTDFNEAFDGETAALNGVTGAFSYDGRGGDDRAWGGGDGDTFIGGAGDDHLFGRAGEDIAIYSGNRSDYTVTLFAPGIVQIRDDRPGSPDGTDLIEGVERVIFANNDYWVEPDGTLSVINDAPLGIDHTLTVNEDQPYAFTVADFSFTEIDPTEANQLLEVTIVDLPAQGTIYYDADGAGGNDPVAITAGSTFTAADLNAGRLTYVADLNENGPNYATFTYQVRDDGGTAHGGFDTDPVPNTITIDVTPVNDAPTSTLLANDTRTYFEGSAAVTLDVLTNGTIADVDSANFDGGSLTLSIGSPLAEDNLVIINTAIVTTAGNIVSVDGTAIGTFSGGGSGTPLAFAFNANATPAAVQLLVRAIGYTNSGGDTPVGGFRTITWTLNDGDGNANGGNPTLSFNSRVNVVPINDGPSSADVTVQIDEDNAYHFDASLFAFSDPEGNQPGALRIETLPSHGGLYYDPDGDESDPAIAVSPGLSIPWGSLANLLYVPDPDRNGIDSFTFAVVDDAGAADQTPNIFTFDVAAVNDGPTVDISPGGGGFQTDEQVALDLKSTISIGDIDSGSGTITVTLSVDYGILTVTAGGSGAGVADSGTGTVTITGTLAQIQALLGSDATSSVTYTPDTDAPPATAELSVTIDDEGNTGSPGNLTANATETIAITAINDAPVVDLNDGTPGLDDTNVYVEGGGASGIGASIAVSDPDSGDNIESATITITDPETGDILTVNLPLPPGIMVDTVNSTATTLILIGSATPAAYAAALGQVGYSSSSSDPTDGGTNTNRLITVVVNDGTSDSAAATMTMTVADVNDEPTLVATGLDPTYTENGAAVDLFSGVTVTTPEGGQALTSLTLTVSNVTDGASEILSFDGSDVALTNGNSVLTATNGLTVNVTVSSGTATVSFSTASLTPAQVNTLVDAMTYRNASENPTDADRVVTITQLVDDGSSVSPNDNSATLSVASTVNVNPVNDAANITGDAAGDVTEAGGVNNGTAGTPTDTGDLDSTDVDNPNDAWQAVLAGGTTISGYGTYALTAAGVWTYTLDDGNAAVQALHGAATLTDTFNAVTADGTAQLVTITIHAQDDAPVIQPDAVTTDEATLLNGNVFNDNGSGADADPDSALTVSAVNGSGASVGMQITLASGAKLTVNTNGTFAYDPNHAFDATPTGGSGASNTPAHDSFDYTLAGGGTATVSVTVTGLDTDDELFGTAGLDMLSGGIGNDLYHVDNSGDLVFESNGAGNDRILTSVSYVLAGGSSVETLEAVAGTSAINLTGNGFSQTLIGNAGVNVLHGGGGTDILSGLGGNDVYFTDVAATQVIEATGGGSDQLYTSVSYVLGSAEIELLSTSSTAGTSAINLTGNSFNQTLVGNNGANVLHGGGGTDTLIGYGGNDVYFTDVAATQVNEAVGGGNDQIYTSVSYVLNGAEVELLSTSSTAGTGAINLTGNGFSQTLLGNNGVNQLHGGGGADTLVGYGGNDIYFTDVAATQAVEAAGGGNDQVYSSVSYVLTAGSEVELLSTNSTAGTGAINLTGNAFGQTLIGNNGANMLHGGGGVDTLIGHGGNDIYFTDVAATQVVEAVGGGSDQLYTSVSYVLAAGSEVELLSTSSTAGTSAINLTGNSFNQTLVGNNGANVLHGGGGTDTLIGYGGNDVYFTDVAATQVNEAVGGGNDQIYTSVSYVLNGAEVELLSTSSTAGTGAINLTGNGFSQTLLGNNGVNQLHGGGGADTLVGYGGNDIYFTDVAATQAVEAAGGGSDQLYSSVSYALTAGSEIELLSTNNTAGTGAIDLTGNEFAQTLLGNAGANTLDGKGGSDTLLGFGGADTFAFTTALGAGNVDTIGDFAHGIDKIALDDAVFGALAPGALAASAFHVGTAATDANQRIIYDSATGNLYYDADGIGGQAQVLFANLQGQPTLTASDFTVI